MPFDSTPVTNPVIERLRLGRERVEKGWCQKAFYADYGRKVCALGAIRNGEQFTLFGIWRASRSKEATYLRAVTGHGIVRWNDSPERTQANVIALYDRAIDLAIADEMEKRG